MRKNILGILAFVMAFVMIGGVSAVCTITIDTPQINQFYKGGNIPFSWTPSSDCIGANFDLYYRAGNCSLTPGTSWTKFKDNLGETTSYPWSSGTKEGKYCLRVEEDNNQASAATSGLFTIDNEDPVANIVVTGNKIQYEELTFYGNGSTDDNGVITNYTWEFGDDQIGTGNVTTHAYNEADTYTVKLTVTDLAGNKGTATKTLTIEDIHYEKPSTVFEAGIRNMLNLEASIETGLTGPITCSVVPSSTPIDGLILDDAGSNCTFDWTNIPYSYRGLHELSIKASDGINTPKYFKVDITVYTWMAPLVVTNENYGWNMFSIPMRPAEPSKTSVLANINNNMASPKTVWQYDAKTQAWKTTTEIVPGYAYRVKMKANDTLKGYGNIEGSQVDVVNGWNAIGHYGINSVSVDEALTSLTLGGVKYYDNVLSTTFAPYQGYFVTVKFLPDESELYMPSNVTTSYILA